MSFLSKFIEFRYYCLLKRFRRQFKRLEFDTRKIDSRIAHLADSIYKKYNSDFISPGNQRPTVAYIASELYSCGGHTPCVVNLAESMANQKGGQVLFLSRLQRTEQGVPTILQHLRSVIGRVEGVDDSVPNVINNTISLYNQIVRVNPRNLVIFIHQNDILSAMVLHLLRQHTDINLIFWNHASHYPNVGMHFVHCILEGTPTTRSITEEKRYLHNCKLIGLQSRAKGKTKYYDEASKQAKRAEFGIAKEDLLTVSGGNARKFFEADDSSEYFEMILRLLKAMPHMKHIVMSAMGKRERKVIDKIFATHTAEFERLIILPPSSEYEFIFQCSDLYIDSVPIGSAMTQIDCMRNKVPTVVYINRNNPEHSFHEYMPPNYPYMYDSIEAMEQGVHYLLTHPDAKQKAVELNYAHWLANYERNAVQKKYLDIFEAISHEHSTYSFA